MLLYKKMSSSTSGAGGGSKPLAVWGFSRTVDCFVGCGYGRISNPFFLSFKAQSLSSLLETKFALSIHYLKKTVLIFNILMLKIYIIVVYFSNKKYFKIHFLTNSHSQ